MPGDVEVQHASTIMADDEEAVEHAERDRRNGKEIHGGDGFPVITKKGKPALARPVLRRSFHRAGNGSLGNIKTQHAKFAVDARCAPSGILGDHAEDQIPNLLGSRSSASLLRDPGNQPPIQKETSSMPAHDRFWSDDEERLLPSGPDSPQRPRRACRSCPGLAAYGAASERKVVGVKPNFRKGHCAASEEAVYRSNEKSGESKHGKELYQNAGTTPAAWLLIAMSAAVLARTRNGNWRSLLDGKQNHRMKIALVKSTDRARNHPS